MNQRKIILYPNTENDTGFQMTRKVRAILENSGWHTVLCPAFDNDFDAATLTDAEEFSNLEDELPTAEMIITFGGDGTILQAARAAAELGIPILGINLGGKGFMAELEAEDIELLNFVTEGDYRIETRIMIDVEVERDGEVICRDFALNDVVIKGDNKVIDITIFGDNQKITRFSGDGTVIATPTG